MTYTELKSRADSYMHRTDLAALWPTFISLAESFMFRELNLREFETSLDGNTIDSYITLPNDFGSVSRLTVPVSGKNVNLDYINRPDDVVSVAGSSPIGYSQENGKLRIYPSTSNQDYTLYYMANLMPLSDSVATNWLSLNAADLYLYATCLEASKWTRDGDQILILNQMLPALIESVKRLSERRAKPSSGYLQIKVRQ